MTKRVNEIFLLHRHLIKGFFKGKPTAGACCSQTVAVSFPTNSLINGITKLKK
jgi:hypothetical protein